MEAAVIEAPVLTGEGVSFEEVWAILKDLAERQKETDQLIKETGLQMKETDRIIGKLGNRFGELAEHLVTPGIADKFNDFGYHFNGVAFGGYEIRDDNGMTIAEVDILLENGDCIMAVEVKAKPRIQDIKHHIKRLKILRKHRNRQNDKRKIFGAVAGAVFGNDVKKAVISEGFFILEQSGDTMKMNVPAGFMPKEF